MVNCPVKETLPPEQLKSTENLAMLGIIYFAFLDFYE